MQLAVSQLRHKIGNYKPHALNAELKDKKIVPSHNYIYVGGRLVLTGRCRSLGYHLAAI